MFLEEGIRGIVISVHEIIIPSHIFAHMNLTVAPSDVSEFFKEQKWMPLLFFKFNPQ